MSWLELDESNMTEKCKRLGCNALRWNQWWWCQPHTSDVVLAGIQFKHQTGLEPQDDWLHPEQGFAPSFLRPGLNIIVMSSNAAPTQRDRSPKRAKKQPTVPKAAAVKKEKVKKEKVKKVPAPAKAKAAPKAQPVKRPPKAALPEANQLDTAQSAMAQAVARYLPTKTASSPPKSPTSKAANKMAKERLKKESAARVKFEAKLKKPVRVNRETE